MHDRAHKEMGLQECSVLIVHNRDRGTCRTVGGDRRKGKDRLVIRDTETLHRIQRFASSYAEHHVRLLIKRHSAQFLNCRVSTVFSVNLLSDDFKAGLLYIRFNLVIGGCKGFPSADHKDLPPIRFTHRADLVIDLIPDRIIRQVYFVVLKFHILYLLSSARHFSPIVPKSSFHNHSRPPDPAQDRTLLIPNVKKLLSRAIKLLQGQELLSILLRCHPA